MSNKTDYIFPIGFCLIVIILIILSFLFINGIWEIPSPYSPIEKGCDVCEELKKLKIKCY